MRISDGSSDVCSSDLPSAVSAAAHYDAASEALDTDFLGPDRGAAMVFYSPGSTGWKSYHAARQAAEAGYNNVMWMRGGYADWAAGNHPIAADRRRQPPCSPRSGDRQSVG